VSGGIGSRPEMNEAVLVVGADGRYEDASAAALDMLGLSLDELRALPPRTLSTTPPDEADALREEWTRLGATAAAGEGNIRRPDGTEIRVRFVLRARTDGRYEAVLQPATTSRSEPLLLYTAGEVLAEWRAAERRLSEIEPGSKEWELLRSEIATFREKYRSLFDLKTQQRGEAD
jgi:PAS domain S-box-containing protein